MKASLKINLIAAVVTVVLIGSVIAWGYDKVTAIEGKSSKTPEIAEQVKAPTIDELSPEGRAIETLKIYHEQFNMLVGYGNDDNFTKVTEWDSSRTNDALNSEAYRQLAAMLSNYQGAEIDLHRAADLATIAREKHDVQALIYLHRILHDLDLNYFNKTPGSDYWGVTETIRHTSEAAEVVPDNRDKIKTYIEKNRRNF